MSAVSAPGPRARPGHAPGVAPIAGSGQRLVAVVAHPDDETFGCGSLLAGAAAAGAHVTVVCATRGEVGERRPDPRTDHLSLAELRERELHAAADVLGVTRVVLLGHRDSGFGGTPDPAALCAVPLAELTEQIAEQCTALRADVVVTLDGCDGHRDHVHLRDAVVAACAALEPQPTLVLASLPNSLMRRWAAEMHQLRSGRAHLEIDPELLGRPDEELVALDGTNVLAVRERAIACHRSQASPFDELSPELRSAFLSTDFVVAPGSMG